MRRKLAEDLHTRIQVSIHPKLLQRFDSVVDTLPGYDRSKLMAIVLERYVNHMEQQAKKNAKAIPATPVRPAEAQ